MYKDVVMLRPGDEIFADKQGIKRSEFYAALQAGITTDLSFTVKSFDYDGQHELEYDGVIYNVIRTYPKGEDDIELICQRTDRDPVFHFWELDTLVTLYKLVTTATEDGGDKQVPTIFSDNLLVKVETLSGREYTEERRNKSELTHKVTAGYLPDLNKSMYFLHNGRKLIIEYVVDINDKHVMQECYCREEQQNE